MSFLRAYKDKNGHLSEAEEMLNNINKYKDAEKYLNNISFIKSLQGTWEVESGSKQVIFTDTGNEVVIVKSPYSQDISVDSRKYTLVNSELKDELGAKYHVDKGKLYKIEGNNTEEYNRVGASTDIPKAKSSPQIGMTARQVEDSTWGAPKKINKTTTKYGVREQWVYNGSKYIYLDDGIVTAIQE